jgi:hypothetical protein
MVHKDMLALGRSVHPRTLFSAVGFTERSGSACFRRSIIQQPFSTHVACV